MILLDAYALVALLADEPAAAETEKLLREGDCAAVVVNLAEAVDVACRVHGLTEEDVRSSLEPLFASKALTAVAPGEATAWRAVRLRVHHYARRARPVSPPPASETRSRPPTRLSRRSRAPKAST